MVSGWLIVKLFTKRFLRSLEITKDHFLKFAVMTSRVRAEYLGAAFELVETGPTLPDESVIKEIRAKRERYEEAVEAFESLKRAIERGYVDVATEGTTT
jgi:hypothetical protein